MQTLIGDARTRLSWYAQILCRDVLSYQAAQEFCTALPQGMRVPSAKELLTLVDPTRGRPAMDPVAFGDTPADALLWSSSLAKYAADDHWLLQSDFGVGVYEQLAPMLPPSSQPDAKRPYCVRCVQ